MLVMQCNDNYIIISLSTANLTHGTSIGVSCMTSATVPDCVGCQECTFVRTVQHSVCIYSLELWNKACVKVHVTSM